MAMFVKLLVGLYLPITAPMARAQTLHTIRVRTNTLYPPNKVTIAQPLKDVGTRNGIYSVRIEDNRLWHLIKDTGGIDGLESDGKGNYIISDWQGKIQLVNTENEPIILLNTSEKGINAADLEYITERNMLLVPTFSDNRVMAYELLY